MFNIQRVDLKDKNAKNNFFTSFQNTGFAVIENHDISFDLIDNVYSDWEQFFNSEEKINYKFDTNSQDGFFPFRSESAKDNPIKDLKEFFHVYPNTNLPNFLSKNTNLLYSELVSLGNTLLGWLDDLTPNTINMPNSNIIIINSSSAIKVWYQIHLVLYAFSIVKSAGSGDFSTCSLTSSSSSLLPHSMLYHFFII